MARLAFSELEMGSDQGLGIIGRSIFAGREGFQGSPPMSGSVKVPSGQGQEYALSQNRLKIAGFTCLSGQRVRLFQVVDSLGVIPAYLVNLGE